MTTTETPQTAPQFYDRDDVIRTIRTALKARTGRTWSVTGGRGTAWGWVTITAPPARRDQYGHMTADDRAVLADALGKATVYHGGETIPPQSDYRTEYVQRATGQPVTVVGVPAWD